jgi:hypothetical protein
LLPVDRKKTRTNARLGKAELDANDAFGAADPTAREAVHACVKQHRKDKMRNTKTQDQDKGYAIGCRVGFITPTVPFAERRFIIMKTKTVLTIKKSSEEFGFPELAIRTLVKQGVLPCIRVGNRSYIVREVFAEYLRRGGELYGKQ